MSDHMNEAVNYVKDLNNQINELSSKRDELQKELASSVSDSGSSSNNCTPSRVVIHSCLGGLVVMISSGFREQGFPVSRVLEVLFEQGLDVVNCVSTKVNQVLLLTIHTEVRLVDQYCQYMLKFVLVCVVKRTMFNFTGK